MEQGLRFREDGTFTIVQFTDLHWQNGDEKDRRTRALMDAVLEAERPDLVVFTGDAISGGECADPRRSLREAVDAAESRGLPWAAVFGNHDAEGSVSRAELLDVLLEHKHSVTRHTEGVSGFGNYMLEIRGSGGGTGAALYFLDSGDYSPVGRIEGYDWIRRDRIDWYAGAAADLAARNGGAPLPALAFFHIPLPEYGEVWDKQICHGSKLERVCAPRVNSGMFAAMVEAGDVMGTFVGHDHINDYWGELHGIRLCYGRATGYNTYGQDGFPHGARMIRLREGERTFSSWLRLDDGTVIVSQKEHLPEA
ncbi:metallophosphoesterase family protein [Cohnella cellulosilytica]|uniref:Metallophosphoesterase family protein n=1 Tax=Cohnella cellulosilytica TaxID=986710 RepID=A0ABW2FH49_9BACL